MKTRMRNRLAAVMTAIVLLTGLALPAQAANNPFAAMEAQSRQAVEAAIKAGTVPPGTTIYDCMYASDANGVTVVVQYRDKGGNWIAVSAGQAATPAPVPPAAAPSAAAPTLAPVAPALAPAQTGERLSEETLAEYVAECFRLINVEREKEGLAPLLRNETLDNAAAIRAAEIIVVDHAGGKAHTRPDGTSYKDLLDSMGVQGRRCGENIARSESTPAFAVEAWMRSDGHRKNILREDYGTTGIGVYQLSDGSLDWVQIFELA